ncbi:general odorant-binding protein 83a-like [Anoplophora glabripennis]|uniref:general odorant-binding protein 83a-like n=1 Tax=Anoplophora glabripennis TaxID=217634 RepID=UPI000A12C480|nr:general odorant-binding protein 83a-like [Anoplophora glabripennis]
MNTVVLFLFLCIISFSAVQCSIEKEQEAYHYECVAQTGVDQLIIMKAMGGNFIDDSKFKSYLLCFGKKMGVHNNAGDIQRDVMRTRLMEMVPEEAIVDKMMECAVNIGTPEDTAFEGCKCLYAIKQQLVN